MQHCDGEEAFVRSFTFDGTQLCYGYCLLKIWKASRNPILIPNFCLRGLCNETKATADMKLPRR
jgi:hypothetical protein